MTVNEARKRARKHLVEVIDGVDPLEERHAPQDLRFREFADVYMDRHARPRKRTWRADEGRLNLHILPALGRSGQ